ncbi:uncharacterized protein [Acropora muricata]|uniref:uncharacterized protein n=1 Tax=Acropora muricata TaxID=159855 RepID=UPI0034E50E8F
MAFPLGCALLGLFFRLIFEVEAAPYKCNKDNVESEAGLDREYSFTNRGGSAWGHGSGEEGSSISPVLLTVLVTLILAVLYQCMKFLRQVAIALEELIWALPGDRYTSMSSDDNWQASKPLVNLVNDHSDFVENIFEHLDTYVEGTGHYEVVAKYFGFSIYTIKSRFEKADGGSSRAMIEAIVARQPEITVESFAKVVEKKARRRDVTNLLRAYDLDLLKESV